jgi:dinuclear metal center YbgI/SA1388 family protein
MGGFMKIGELVNELNKRIPLNLAESWDNPGIIVGDFNSELTGAVVSLDYHEKVYAFAKEKNINFIFTHHPLIFNSLKKIDTSNFIGKTLFELIRNDISLYAAHTNLDSMPGGVNDVLADKLGLINTFPIEKIIWDGSGEAGMGRIGELERPIKLIKFSEKIKEILKIDIIQVTGDKNQIVKKIAVCGGSGGRIASKAADLGCQVLVTGDVGYHSAQDALRAGISVIDATHYATEVIILDKMKEILEEITKFKINIFKMTDNLNTFYYL